ncbi:MAG: hypothetical protein WBH85_07815 [Thermoanaerobaculia bacterium]
MSLEDIRRRLGADLMLLVCLCALVGLEVFAWRVAHRDESELDRAAVSGSAEERVWALHILLNRGEPPQRDQSFVEGLVAAEEALVRELAMTSIVRRHVGRSVQRQVQAEISGPGELLRGRYYMKRHGRPIKRSFLRDYFRSLED